MPPLVDFELSSDEEPNSSGFHFIVSSDEDVHLAPKQKKKKKDSSSLVQKSIKCYKKKKERGESSIKASSLPILSDSEEKNPPKMMETITISSDSDSDYMSSVKDILNMKKVTPKPKLTIKKKFPKSSPSEKATPPKKSKPVTKRKRTQSSEEEEDAFTVGDLIAFCKEEEEEEEDNESLKDFIVNEESDDSTVQPEEAEYYTDATDTDVSTKLTEEEEYKTETDEEIEDEPVLSSQEPAADIISIDSDYDYCASLLEEEKRVPETVKDKTGKFKRLVKNPPKLTDAGNGWKKDEDDDYYLEGGLVLDSDIYKKLYSFQKESVKWMNSKFTAKKFRGGILADEMGLGKTVQVSAFLGGLANGQVAKRFLIVAPLAVLATWNKELSFWASGVTPYMFHALTKNDEYERMIRTFYVHTKNDPGVIITTYQTLSSKISLFESLISKIENFDVTIIDEGHNIKNHETGAAKALRKIPSKGKFALTGTPIMNKLMEMWAIYDYIFYRDNLLGDKKEFKSNYERPIVKSRKRDASSSEKALGNKLSQKLRASITPYFLRRTKAQVLETDHAIDSIIKKSNTGKAKISQKNELVLWCCLSKCQDLLYTQYLKSDIVRQIMRQSDKSNILSAMSALRTICNHPRQHKGTTNGVLRKLKTASQNGMKATDEIFQDDDDDDLDDCSIASDLTNVRPRELISESTKLKVVVKLLVAHKTTGHRTLIFSQFTSMLDLVEKVITDHLKYKYFRIDGTTSNKDRQRFVDAFNTNDEYTCFLITTGAGGVGLTLTGADRVILIDPHWNPAVDQQAVDRAYRVGQTRNVVTYRLITVGTIEEIMYRRQVSKDGLIKNTLTKENQYRYFTSDQEVLEVFQLRDKRSSETQKLLDQLHPKGKMYEELENHVKELENYEEINGVTWHDMLYNTEADDLDESIQYEEDAKIQQKQAIRNYLKPSAPVTIDLVGSSSGNTKPGTSYQNALSVDELITRLKQQHPKPQEYVNPMSMPQYVPILPIPQSSMQPQPYLHQQMQPGQPIMKPVNFNPIPQQNPYRLGGFGTPSLTMPPNVVHTQFKPNVSFRHETLSYPPQNTNLQQSPMPGFLPIASQFINMIANSPAQYSVHDQVGPAPQQTVQNQAPSNLNPIEPNNPSKH